MMVVFDLAEISSVLGILYTLCRLKHCGCYAFGRCPWFHIKSSVSAAGTGIWPLWFSTIVYFGSLVGVGLYQDCTSWANVTILVRI
jgi:hypothetical protein